MSLVPDVWRQPFPESEIPFILAAILRCMATMKKAEPCERENDITIRLWKKLLRDPDLKKSPTHLDTEASELNEADEDGKIGRTDLRFLLLAPIKPTPFFAIEAKRLHVTFPRAGRNSLVPEYVTSHTSKPVAKEQGMMCFISGRYSRGLRAGAMLGYVFDGEVEAAREAIAAAIATHAKKLRLVPSSWLTRSAILPGETGISESQHDLWDEIDLGDLFRGRFTIYHLLVPV